MKNVLIVRSSVNGAASISNRMLDIWLAHARERLGEVHVVERDLAAHPVPLLTPETVAAIRAGVVDTPARIEADRLARELVAELQAADEIALGLPRYNFQTPAGFKSYIDTIARPRITFRYTESGPEGLLTNKPTYALMASGGQYPAESDFYVPWLRQVLGFLGLKDVRIIQAQGVAMDADGALARATAAIKAAA